MRQSRFLAFFRSPMLLVTLIVAMFIALTAVATAAEETVIPPVQSGLEWKAIAGNTLLTILQVVGTGIATLLGAALLWVCRKLAAKLHIEMSAAQDEQVYAAAEKAVAYAEEWARTTAGATGSEKADIALKVLHEVLDSKTFTDYGEPALRKLIDASVAKLRAENVAVPAEPVPA